MARARTRKQGMALTWGKVRYSTGYRGWNLEHIARRNRIEAECAAAGLQMCWQCERGFAKNLDTCPHCQTEVIPF